MKVSAFHTLVCFRRPGEVRNSDLYIVAITDGKETVLLSTLNIYLSETCGRSEKTSLRYARVAASFVNDLIENEYEGSWPPVGFLSIVSNQSIKNWQSRRQNQRVKLGLSSPTSKTILEEARLVAQFFNWLGASQYGSSVDISTKTHILNFRDKPLLSYRTNNSVEAPNISDVKALDLQAKQKNRTFSLIKNSEIVALSKAYSDPVYTVMFRMALGTAMRPMDLCKFPFIGAGENSHILPFSEMSISSRTIEYNVVESKGNKSRKIQVHSDELRMVDEDYIKPFFQERKKLYEERCGKPLSPGVLFLNKKGEPVTPAMIASRTNYAKEKCRKDDSSFRKSICFYDARHWWPTMYLIQALGDKLLDSATQIFNLALAQALQSQMGHNDLETTFKYYVDRAALVYAAHKGILSDLVVKPDLRVSDFVDGLSRQEHH